MNIRGIVLFILGAAVLSASSTHAFPEAEPPNEPATVRMISPEDLELYRLATAGALSLLVETQEEDAGELFQARFAIIERRVGGRAPSSPSGGSWWGYIYSKVPGWFRTEEKRVELGRQLVALTKTDSLTPETFFGLISLGGFLVLTNDADGQYVAETAHRVAEQASKSLYDPEPLLNDLVTFISTFDPKAANTSTVLRRCSSFFYCLRDCLSQSPDNHNHNLTAVLDASVRAYLCESRGKSADCTQDLDQMAKKAHFPRCPN